MKNTASALRLLAAFPLLLAFKLSSAADTTASPIDIKIKVSESVQAVTQALNGIQQFRGEAKLPGGGSAHICVKHDSFPDGREFVGKGIVPDIEILPTVAYIRAGRDVVLDKAVAVLSK